MIKGYRKHIAENRNLVYISTFAAILFKAGFFLSNYPVDNTNTTFFWHLLNPLFENGNISFFFGLLFTILIGIQAAHLNVKYTLIRGRTSLPYVFTVLILAGAPQLALMSPIYIGLCTLMIGIDFLFSSYHSEFSSPQAFKTGFFLAIGSFFCPSIILYFLLFWIGLSIMRSFNFKSFLAFLCGAIIIFWIAFFLVLYFQKTYLIQPGNLQDTIREFEFPELEVGKIIFFALYVFIFSVVLFESSVNGYKDKIQTRTYLMFIKLASIFSVIIYFLFIFQSGFNLITAIVLSGLILSHFFALADKKWKVYFFTILVIFYLANYLYVLTN